MLNPQLDDDVKRNEKRLSVLRAEGLTHSLRKEKKPKKRKENGESNADAPATKKSKAINGKNSAVAAATSS